MSAQLNYLYTPQEYLLLERSAFEKHEYFQGELFTMAGASNNHNIISINIIGSLRRKLQQQGCRLYANDMRTRVSTSHYTYPDIVVVCGKPEFLDNAFDTLLNPVVIMEILSDSTKEYDRTRKFDHYRTIPSLREYVLLEQDMVRVERYSRIENPHVPPERTLWAFQAITTIEESLTLQSVDCTVPLTEIYEDIEFEERVAEQIEKQIF
jgi:Uma2 family endonuclease